MVVNLSNQSGDEGGGKRMGKGGRACAGHVKPINYILSVPKRAVSLQSPEQTPALAGCSAFPPSLFLFFSPSLSPSPSLSFALSFSLALSFWLTPDRWRGQFANEARMSDECEKTTAAGVAAVTTTTCPSG
jgi:hypothetical protein